MAATTLIKKLTPVTASLGGVVVEVVGVVVEVVGVTAPSSSTKAWFPALSE
jgi:hypothetical protein